MGNSPPTIFLGGTPKRFKQNIGSKILDQISSLLLEPKTVVTKGLGEAGRLVKKRRPEISRTKDISKALDVVGETLTSTLVAGGLILGAANPAIAGSVAKSLIPKTIGGKIGAITAGGIVTTSGTARKLLGNFLQDPAKIGREAGILIDKAVAGKDTGGVVEALKVAGLIGGGVAATVGAKKIVDKFFNKTPKVESPQTVNTTIALPTDNVPDVSSPIADTPVVASTPKPIESISQMPDINIKVISKPQVNVAMAQSI